MSFDYKKQLFEQLDILSNFTYSVALRVDYNPEQEKKWLLINQEIEELIENIEKNYFSEE